MLMTRFKRTIIYCVPTRVLFNIQRLLTLVILFTKYCAPIFYSPCDELIPYKFVNMVTLIGFRILSLLRVDILIVNNEIWPVLRLRLYCTTTSDWSKQLRHMLSKIIAPYWLIKTKHTWLTFVLPFASTTEI